MKVKRKNTIYVLVLFAVLVLFSSVYLFKGSIDEKELSHESEKLFGKGDFIYPELPEEDGVYTYTPPLERVDKLLDEMEFGTIAFNTPSNINIEDFPQIQLELSLTETLEKLKQSITEEGEKVGANIRVSDRMEAHLSGSMFQIDAIRPEMQAVSKSQNTKWQWEIHPKEEGKHRLHLTLTAHFVISGYSTPRAIKTFDRFVEVHVTAAQKASLFFNNNWQWLWAAVLVPVVGWLWKRKQSS